MELTVGIHSDKAIDALADVGVKEVFLGYVPFSFYERFGNVLPENRREVRFCEVQFHSLSEMEILFAKLQRVSMSAAVTMNALCYTPEMLSSCLEQIKTLTQIGFEQFIIADPGLLLAIAEAGICCQVHISGDFGTWTSSTSALMKKALADSETVIRRIIFQRRTSTVDLKTFREAEQKSMHPIPEMEAFLLNEQCQFSGAFCAGVHGDEMVPLCLLPYQPGRWKPSDPSPAPAWYAAQDREETDGCSYGASGCGICALWKLRDAGVTHLKLVGRGEQTKRLVSDARVTRKMLQLLDEAPTEAAFLEAIYDLRSRCKKNCYYRL